MISENLVLQGASPVVVQRPSYDWLFRYKLYHLPFWFVYHYAWWSLTLFSVQKVANSILYTPYSIKFFFYVIFQAVGVYFNLYFLMPRLLEKGKVIPYVALVVLTIVVTGLLIVPGYYVSAWLSGCSFESLYGHACYFELFGNNVLPSSAASMTLAMSIKLTKNWIQAKQREQLLEKEKLETELKFLRSQFNPHFLFNTINSIFVLIHKNPRMASESLVKFSDLLRYQLYECNEQKIPLSQELVYLENFIELQKLRQDHDHVELTVRIEPFHTGNLGIAPFVLIPFIENAFKHVSQRKDQLNWIRMSLRFDGQQLHLDIANSISAHYGASTELIHHGGIGLQNVKRRLDLLYPGKHALEIHQDDDQFRITLRLDLQEGGSGALTGAN